MTRRLSTSIAGAICFAIVISRGVRGTGAEQQPPSPAPPSSLMYRPVLERYCTPCHNQKLKTAGMILDTIDLAHVADQAPVWEKVVRKLRAGEMPPAGRPRPDKATYDAFSSYLESELDRAAAVKPYPGKPTLHRLNRAEYASVIRDLLALDIDGRSLLPADNAGYGFDNVADVLSVSPVLMERYISAATTISRMALGRIGGSPPTETYSIPGDLLQDDRVDEQLPFGSRGGAAIRHYFPVDGEYLFKIRLQRTLGGAIRGLADPHQLDIRIDGQKVRSFTVGGKRQPGDNDPFAASSAYSADDGLQLRVSVRAGSRLVGATFVQRTSSLIEDLLEPSLRNTFNPNDTSGNPDIASVAITGPYTPGATLDTASRRRILVCRPASRKDEASCVKTILSTLARRAYRRPTTNADLKDLLPLYHDGRAKGDFESGIEMALRGLLVSPEFLFRFERKPANVTSVPYRISDIDLASRLSFFLWSSIPDDELLNLATNGRLSNPPVLEQQVRRMLADWRSRALVTNFAGQWLHTRNVPVWRPNPEVFPTFNENLRRAFQRETELFFESIVREDRSVLDVLNANYTFVDERLARHYGIPNVYGDAFRRVTLGDDHARRGLLGQGSILMVTSYANRTSPVLRGKWILENLLGTPPPPPLPDVPPLPEKPANGRMLPMRERLAQHRANPVCASCHARMDPLGFALENFDATGKWRTVDESGKPIDASGVLVDGTRFEGVDGLRKMLLDRSDMFISTVIERLLTYALGRGVEYYDAPTIRQIKRESARNDYRMSSVMLALVRSAPFQMSVSGEGVAVPTQLTSR